MLCRNLQDNPNVAENLLKIEKERADLEKESAQDELAELKEQLELKDRSIQHLRATPGKARLSLEGPSSDTVALREQIKELQRGIQLEKRQRIMLVEGWSGQRSLSLP